MTALIIALSAILIFSVVKVLQAQHDSPSDIEIDLIDNEHLRSGNKCFEDKDYHGAVFHYKKLIENDNQFLTPIAWSNLASSYRYLESYDDAIKAHIRSLETEPNNSNYRYSYGVTLQLKGNLKGAIEEYHKVIETNPDYINAYYNTALAYHDIGELDNALKFYSQVLKRDSHHIEARLNTCNILFAMKKYNIAEKCYHDVLKVNPSYVRGLINLASFYQISSNLSDIYHDPSSHQDSQESSKKEENNQPEYTYLQVVIDLYKQALELEPTNKIAFHGLRSLLQENEAAFSLGLNNNGNNTDMSNNTTTASTSSMIELDPSNSNSDLFAMALDKTSEIDKSYIRELFDSYAYHFEHALVHELKYYSHTLVANAIEKYYKLPIRRNKLNTTSTTFKKDYGFKDEDNNFNNDTIDIDNDIMIYKQVKVLDLGAGTGLACFPVKNAIQQIYTKTAITTNSNSINIYSNISITDDIDNNNNINVSITAVDLSDKMLYHARQKNCYNDIHVSDVHDFLISETKKNSSDTISDTINFTNKKSSSDTWDIILAADVFVYIGNLSSLLCSIHQITSSDSLIVFTVESLVVTNNNNNNNNNNLSSIKIETENNYKEILPPLQQSVISQSQSQSPPATTTNMPMKTPGYELQSSGRFAHSYNYIIDVTTQPIDSKCKFDIITIDNVILRENKGEKVNGYLVVLKPSSSISE